MGKGIIKSGGTDGLYNVELTLNRERVDNTITIIDAQIAELNSTIAGMDEGDAKELTKLKRNSCKKKKEYLQNNMPEDITVSAWCADLTEGISGNIGTIEVPGERGIVQIQPGYEDNAAYSSARDGQLQPSMAGTPSGTFYNLAMLPGWQKWKPTYRYGTISNIDYEYNTGDVKLDATESSQQSLDINQELNLSGIPVSYMNCDSSAFGNGDNVLVKFDNREWSGAKVVGFKDNPNSCSILCEEITDENLGIDISDFVSYEINSDSTHGSGIWNDDIILDDTSGLKVVKNNTICEFTGGNLPTAGTFCHTLSFVLSESIELSEGWYYMSFDFSVKKPEILTTITPTNDWEAPSDVQAEVRCTAISLDNCSFAGHYHKKRRSATEPWEYIDGPILNCGDEYNGTYAACVELTEALKGESFSSLELEICTKIYCGSSGVFFDVDFEITNTNIIISNFSLEKVRGNVEEPGIYTISNCTDSVDCISEPT